METDSPDETRSDTPWWGIWSLFLGLVPFALLSYLVLRGYFAVAENDDGSSRSEYARSLFVGGFVLLVMYIVGIAVQVYAEFIKPKIFKSKDEDKDRC